MKTTVLSEENYRQALAILDDVIFRAGFDNTKQDDIKAIKIYEARKENIDFDYELAEKICGDQGPYPYRSSYYLTKFFQDLGFIYSHDGSTRRYWVESVLKELPIRDIVVLIEKGLFRKRDFKPIEDLSVDDLFDAAIIDFRKFISESIKTNESVNLVDILDLDVNLEMLFQENANTNDPELNQLVEEAKNRFLKPDDKQIAVEKLWDAFERLKTYFGSGKSKADSAARVVKELSSGINTSILDDEFRNLTRIGNEYKIRHHETDKLPISNEYHLNYLFFRMMSLISLAMKVLNRSNNSSSIW